MARLRHVEAPEPAVRMYRGVMVVADGALVANVGGNNLNAYWADPLQVEEGDPVLVQITTGPSGGSEAVVVARLHNRPRPSMGTVKTVPPGSPTITVTGDDGIDYPSTRFVASYTPVVNDPVVLAWNANGPTVVGKLTATPPAVKTTTPITTTTTTTTTGRISIAAAAADTRWPPGGWGSWAGGGGRVYQGSYGSGPVSGAWFYNGATKKLAGKTITRIRFTLGARLYVGSYNSPITVHFYAHTSSYKPAGDVVRAVGPHNVTANVGQPARTYDLPLSFGNTLKAGGGIAIYGEPYAGFKGPREQANSGLLIVDWRS